MYGVRLYLTINDGFNNGGTKHASKKQKTVVKVWIRRLDVVNNSVQEEGARESKNGREHGTGQLD
jgi:hypothetical protein